MVSKEIIKIARKQIGLYFQSVIESKSLPLRQVSIESGLTTKVIFHILHGNDYTITSFITLAAYLDTHIELSEKSIENSIVNLIGPEIQKN